MSKPNPKIIVLGKEIKKENLPYLYEWGLKNQASLEATVDSVWTKLWNRKEGTLGSCLVNLEMDMEHQNNLSRSD